MKILERTLIFATLLIMGSLLGPIAYKYYTHKPPELIETDQDWTITLTSPNADEYETWYYHGPKPTHIYQSTGSWLRHAKTGNLIKTNTGTPEAPIGWYLYITNGKEDQTLKTTKNQ
jgi:hypothetical protein